MNYKVKKNNDNDKKLMMREKDERKGHKDYIPGWKEGLGTNDLHKEMGKKMRMKGKGAQRRNGYDVK